MKVNLVVVGGGPGGYVAAIRAAQLGLETVLVEAEHLGGICLNWGCIPTKSLLRSSEIYHHLTHAKEFGFEVEVMSVDMGAIVDRSRKIVRGLKAGIGHLLKKNKVTVLEGRAVLMSSNKLRVALTAGGEETISADNIILATGARAIELPHLKADGKHIWTYKQAMTAREIPKSLLVVGSGAIGAEFASFYNDLGAEVTIVESADNILPAEDHEIREYAHKTFTNQGIKIQTSAEVRSLVSDEDGVHAVIRQKDKEYTETFDRTILAIGVTGNVEGLELETVGVKVNKGHIVINPWGQTSVDGIWAIGDVAGAPCLAHKASHEGVIAVEKIAGVAGVVPLSKDDIPGCTYSRPQIASIGMTEEAALKAGYRIRKGNFPFGANGKAIALGETNGFIKTIFDERTGELLGAHLIGADVTELIQGYVIARKLEATEAELMHIVFPHPTLSEMMHESVLDAYDRVIHS
ncbi:MAG: dihydrolipoyl dehydrogenase [Alphaproteobacteria bacterium]|nr:MAG: dihydrolipoyl dehydrogenase [Alphaproteobacteria bacterium]